MDWFLMLMAIVLTHQLYLPHVKLDFILMVMEIALGITFLLQWLNVLSDIILIHKEFVF
jgi:hypothetical protein